MIVQKNLKTLLLVVSGLFGSLFQTPLSHAALLSKWSLDDATNAANAVAGAPSGKVERALVVEGHGSGKALAFTDWSVINYLKPDPAKATRVVIPNDPKLLPSFPFRLSAWIYPTADPIYYGGIAEKGLGYGAAYRLILLRGLKVQASLGDQNIKAVGSVPLSLNEWHEVALAADGRNLALLVDGKEVAKTPIPPGLKISSTEPLVLGNRFTGRIDEVSISSDPME